VPGPPTSALTVTGATKRFGRTVAIDSVDLEVAPGSVRALVGANGSGKSTLIKALAGFHALDAGSIHVHGRELGRGSVVEQGIQAGLRFVHQDLALIPSLWVADNLALTRGYTRDRFGTIRWRREAQRSRAELETVGISVDARTEVALLGPVERTLVAIARALDHVDPGRNVLVLDEPTARLPQEEASRLLAKLRALRDRGLPIVYVTHRLEEVYRLADTVTVLRDGREVFAGTLDSLPLDQLRSIITGLQGARRARAATAARPGGPPRHRGVALELRGVGSRVLRDVDLRVHAGEVVGVSGLIGSGRSELGRVVYGLQKYSSGEVRIAGRPAGFPRSGARYSGKVGYTPQERRSGLLARLPVEENLTVTSFEGLRRGYGISRERLRRAARRVIDELRILPPDPTAVIDVLSGGNQQKVALGKWTRLPLELLVLDEPTQSIDIAAKSDLMQAIRQRAEEEGLAVLWLESDIEEIVKYADRIVVMRDGRVTTEFAERPFAVAEVLAASYGRTEHADGESM
jgi:ribose transport system ATP-binding protein